MSKVEDALSYERAAELWSYDPETGIIRWKASPGGWCGRSFVGKEAGCIEVRRGGTSKTRRITTGFSNLSAHRLAWLLTYREWPQGYVDHINGDELDNRLSNLRLATPSQNRMNSKKPRTNTSGYKGVSWCKARKAWHAGIKRNYKTYNLGYFNDAREAAAAYARAAAQHHGEFARVE